MTDRIADPFGARTPYRRGADWPVRVDMYLSPGITEADVERWVPTASVLHSNGDGLDLAVAGGRIVGVRGQAGDRVNHGRVGVLHARADRPGRHRHPAHGRQHAAVHRHRRRGPEGELRHRRPARLVHRHRPL